MLSSAAGCRPAQKNGLKVALLGALASCMHCSPGVALASMQLRALPIFTAWSQARLACLARVLGLVRRLHASLMVWPCLAWPEKRRG